MNWIDTIYSDGSCNFVSNPTPKKGEEIKITIRVKKNDELKKIMLRTRPGGLERLLPMELEEEKNGLLYFSTKFIIQYEKISYHFYILTKKEILYYNQQGISKWIPNEFYDFKLLIGYNQPKWVKSSVFYQIFPDRFYNGDENNDVKDAEYYFDGYPTIHVKDWNSIPKHYNKAHCLDFYGGDLKGIEKKIPYFKELGVNALYLNPIFMAGTVHRYDCYDYFHVDPHLGGDNGLASLTNALHLNNMKIILDVSINHTGIAHKWFNKDGTFFDKSIGAYNNLDSPYRDFYFFNEKNEYSAWVGVPTLPNLNYSNQKLCNIIFNDEDSLVKKWIKPPYNTDGWRFDVADVMGRNENHELHHVIWPKIAKSIKDSNPNAYILAEEWCDSEEFLRGTEWDSAMNYFGSANPIRDFLGLGDLFMLRHQELNKYIGKADAKKLAGKITSYLSQLPFVMQQNQFNLIDSHDVNRLHNYKIDWNDYRGAIIFLFTLIGCPSIYYGDEIGIDGDTQTVEGCRYPMPWDKMDDLVNNQYYALFKKLSHLKLEEKALIDGGFKVLNVLDGVIMTGRFDKNDLFVTIFSVDDENKELELPLDFFGNNIKLPKFDVFNKEMEYYERGNRIFIKVFAHTSYLIKIKL